MKFFQRVANDDGISTVHLSGNTEPEIKIRGRGVYETDNKKAIDILSEDPNFIEVEMGRKGKIKVVNDD